MNGPADHDSLAGSNRRVEARPLKSQPSLVPPATNSVPSPRREKPLQKILVFTSTGVNSPVCGLNRTAIDPGPPPGYEYCSTLPVFSRAEWIAMTGHWVGVSH